MPDAFIGYSKTTAIGPCVDPFEKGAHMANGGIVNPRYAEMSEPPAIMCEACFGELMTIPEPEGWGE